MDILKEYDNLFGDYHHKICEGKRCECHKEVRNFISQALTKTEKRVREETIREMDERWQCWCGEIIKHKLKE